MRHSKIDQEKLAHKIAEWLQECPQDKFFLRPSMKSASDIFKSAQEGEGRKGGMNTAKPHRNKYKHRTEQHNWNYPKISKCCKLLGFVKLQYCNLIKIKIPTKPHQKSSKTASPQTLTPPAPKKVLEEDEIIWQLNDGDLYADKQSTDLLFVH